MGYSTITEFRVVHNYSTSEINDSNVKAKKEICHYLSEMFLIFRIVLLLNILLSIDYTNVALELLMI